MLKEEKILKDKFGTANHFTVPEGYFDSFAEKLMESLPAPEPQVIEMQAASWWSRLPLRKIAVAASVVAVVGFGSLFFTHQQASQQQRWRMSIWWSVCQAMMRTDRLT